MRKTLDASHEELNRIIEAMIAADVDISAREIARRHSSLKNASAFTRHAERSNLIDKAKQRQTDARNVRGVPTPQRTASLAGQLAEKSERLKVLEERVAVLVASHVACVRAVMKHGGVQALQRFWKDYRQIGEGLEDMQAVPQGAQVIALTREKSNPTAE